MYLCANEFLGSFIVQIHFYTPAKRMLSEVILKSACLSVCPLTLYSIGTRFNTSTTDSFENMVGKGEIARNEQFLLSPQCFLLNQIIVSPFVHIFAIIPLFAAELEEPRIGLSGKGLR